MNTHDEVSLWHALYCLETKYWHEVDCNGGRNAHEFYLPDGLMVVGHNRSRGTTKSRNFTVASAPGHNRDQQREDHAASDQQPVRRVRSDERGQGIGHRQLLRRRRPCPRHPIQAADAGRGLLQRLSCGRGQPMAIQITHPAAGFHEPRDAALDRHRYAPADVRTAKGWPCDSHAWSWSWSRPPAIAAGARGHDPRAGHGGGPAHLVPSTAPSFLRIRIARLPSGRNRSSSPRTGCR